MFLCVLAQTAVPSAFTEEGLKPPWNHPHVIPFAFRRSPTLRPDMVTLVLVCVVQSSSVAGGLASPINEPLVPTMPLVEPDTTLTPCVWPAIKFNAPGVEGPNVVPKLLSLIAKLCA